MQKKKYKYIQIGIASSEEILSWSYGEVKKHETINYRTFKPEREGLFCEVIFGPQRDNQCGCGKMKPVIRQDSHGNLVKVCEKCGVEITSRNVRRERMGHIKLNTPVIHTWFLNNTPCKISVLLDSEKYSTVDVKNVAYYSAYVVTDTGTIEEQYEEELAKFMQEHPDEDVQDLDDCPKDPALHKGQVITEQRYGTLQRHYGRRSFSAETGGEAIRTLLKELDLAQIVHDLREELRTAPKAKQNNIVKRLELAESFLQSDNKPEWMVMDVIPVIPPSLRPMVPLDGGRFATTDLNDLYRRILNRNARLKKLQMNWGPELLKKNEKRLIQEAVDSLFDNGKKKKDTAVEKNHVLKSLSDNLRGKQGRLRQNLLGKRVDYSGRSVIVIGPDLKMYQCGLPREMAMILFKPFIINSITQHEHMDNDPNGLFLSVKTAKELIENNDPIAQKHLEKVVVEHPVLLNRAPTLHRLGIQAFEPVLIDGKAIRLHPLACPAFNADFDGDQMAVHLPISEEAQAEARLLMLASKNILAPKDGKPISTPSQDMVLGNYYLTIEEPNDPRNGRIFSDIPEVQLAYENNQISLHTRFLIPARALHDSHFTKTITKDGKTILGQIDKYLITTYGKIIFNTVFPSQQNIRDNFPKEKQAMLKPVPFVVETTEDNLRNKTPDRFFVTPADFPMKAGTYSFVETDINDVQTYIRLLPAPHPFKKGFLKTIIGEVFRRFQISETSRTLDKIKDLGFHYSTKAGITVSFSDFRLMKDNPKILDAEYRYRTDSIDNLFRRGGCSIEERDKESVATWLKATSDQKDLLQKDQELNSSTNDIYLMGDSGARGDTSNFQQISGVLGIMRSAKGGNLKVPVLSGFQKGLSMSEFFRSTHGARKTSTDTALKTAESGYLTRRLVDVSQDVIVRENDCGTDNGVWVEDLIEKSDKDTQQKIESLSERINGRYTCGPLIAPVTGEVIIGADEFIDEQTKDLIVKGFGVKRVKIRSLLTCDCKHGVCVKCYGSDMSTNETVELGEAVGVIAAQSIGEPGTQLTLRTFHGGGVAGAADITQGLPRVQELFEARTPKGVVPIAEFDGIVDDTHVKDQRNSVWTITLVNPFTKEKKTYTTDAGKEPIVEKGQAVKAGDPLTRGAIDPKELLRVSDAHSTQEYIIREVEKVYKLQNDVSISDKHLEIIVRQMFQKVKVEDEGDTALLPGTLISKKDLIESIEDCLKTGKRIPTVKPVLLGITRASLKSDSFLSAASFQETTRVLTEAAIRSKKDTLEGLKENVIIGGLIPAGTGLVDADWEQATPDEKEVPATADIVYKYKGFEDSIAARTVAPREHESLPSYENYGFSQQPEQDDFNPSANETPLDEKN